MAGRLGDLGHALDNARLLLGRQIIESLLKNGLGNAVANRLAQHTAIVSLAQNAYDG